MRVLTQLREYDRQSCVLTDGHIKPLRGVKVIAQPAHYIFAERVGFGVRSLGDKVRQIVGQGIIGLYEQKLDKRGNLGINNFSHCFYFYFYLHKKRNFIDVRNVTSF